MPSPAAPLRILQVITDTDRRGAQVFACDLAEEMKRVGHEVTTVALAAGSRKPPLDVRTLGRRARGIGTLRALRRAMADADITIAHGSSTLLACSLAGLGRRRRFVYRQISDSRFWAATWHRRVRVGSYLRFPNHIVALSASAATTLTEYLAVPTDRITVVPNGVPSRGLAPASQDGATSFRSQLALPTDAFIAVYVGALVPEKGVDVAIRAVGATPGTHLAVVGDGPIRGELEELAAEYARGKVTFVGGLSDVSPAYGAADVFMLTSKGGDSMPAVLIEAGYCGLASITCPIGAITDVVMDGQTGIVVAAEDVDATTAALARLAGDSASASAMGALARSHCLAHFEIGVVAQQWVAVIQQVLRTVPRHP